MPIRSLLPLPLLLAACLSWPQIAAAETAEDAFPALAKVHGTHPRLFIDGDGAARLRTAILAERKSDWDDFKKLAYESAVQPPFAYQTDVGEQLWQRTAGNRLATLAFGWLISGDRKYLTSATTLAKAICSYPTWGIDAKTGKSEEKGLPYGHQLLGLAMLYDYAFDDLDADTRTLIRTTMRERAGRQLVAFRQRYALLQNHSWINSTGLLAAGLALSDVEPEAVEWIRLPLDILRRSDAMLSPDGASQEGLGYWQYGVEYLLKLDALARLAGRPGVSSPWWDRTADFCLYLMTPRNSWRPGATGVDLADGVRYAWYGPDYLLRALARRNRDGVAQWLADTLDARNAAEPVSPWLSLLWTDATVAPTPPTAKPTLHEFVNMGIVSARSDWSGDESLVVFKAGNPIGTFATERFAKDLDPWDIGHVHRDANHFCLYGAGGWLIRNPGYAMRDAELHNTLTIDGAGQFGDRNVASPWPLSADKPYPRIVEASSSPTVDRIVGDATAAYPPAAGLTRFVRTLLFIKPNALVVVDDVATDAPHRFDLLFHPEAKPVAQADGAFLAEGPAASLLLQPLTGDGVTAATEVQTLTGTRAAQNPFLHLLRLRKQGSAWRNATALTWAPRGTPPPRVTMTALADRWEFTVGGVKAAVTWDR